MHVAHYKGRTRMFNRLVCWYLRGHVSHTELVLCTDTAGVSLCASSSFMDGGVRAKWIALDPEHWELREVIGDRAKALQWLEDHKGQGYDVLGLLGFVWRRIEGARKRWFCSEAVAAMLGLPDPWRFDPMTLWAALSGAPTTPTKPVSSTCQ